MLSWITDHPFVCAVLLILIDLGLWRLISAYGSNWKLAVRLLIFVLFSVLLVNEGLSPLAPAPWAETSPCTIQGCRFLLDTPAACVATKSSTSTGVEYEISGFVKTMDQKRMVRNQLYDLAFRHLQAAGVTLLSNIEPNAPLGLSAPRALLESSPIFSTLREEEKETFSQNMTLQTFRSGEMILPAGVVSDHLFIIESGVVSVALSRDGTQFEAARMGPGEVIGESGILSDMSVSADFSAHTHCTLYRIGKDYLKPCLDARHDINEAMKALIDFRTHEVQKLIQDVPKAVQKKCFFQRLRYRA